MPGPSSSSPTVDAGPETLFVVVSYGRDARYFSSILRFETKATQFASNGRPKIEIPPLVSSPEAEMIEYEYVAHFEKPQGYPSIMWMFSHLPCSPEHLCMVPHWGPRLDQKRAPLHGCIFNFRTKECKSIKPPGGARYYEHVVDLGDYIYFMGDPKPGYEPGFFFARYNRLKDLWETLKPFPYHDIKYQGEGLIGNIVATAVWNNTILLTMYKCGMWAYDVGKNEWHPVCDRDSQSNNIVGKAVVQGNTIYFLAKAKGSIVALSIKRNGIEGDFVFECSLLCKIDVPGMDVVYYDEELTWLRRRDLVHLGDDSFCIVQSCNSFDSIDYQPIQLTYLKRNGKGEESMTVAGTCVHYIHLLQNEQFKVELCFSLPEYKTTTFRGSDRIFAFDPFPEHYPKPLFRYKYPPSLIADCSSKPVLVNDSSRTNMIDEQGHSIKVANIPPRATVKELKEGLRKFGPIKKDGIQIITRTRKEKPYAIVEFKTAPSKQRAIKASTIRIERYQAVILERKQSAERFNEVRSFVQSH